MRVLIITIVTLNPGDAAILRGMQRLIHRALGDSTRIVTIDQSASEASKLYPWMTFQQSLFKGPRRGLITSVFRRFGYGHWLQRMSALRFRLAAKLIQNRASWIAKALVSERRVRVIREYVAADLILASGGTYLVPAYDFEAFLLDYELALSLGKKLIFMPQSLGPFLGHPLEARLMAAFTKSAAIFVRDDPSKRHLSEIGVPANKVNVAPDAAFALVSRATDFGANDVQPGSVVQKPSVLRVAISVRTWAHFASGSPREGNERFAAAIAEFVEKIVLENNAVVTFISTCQGIESYWADDSAVAEKIVDRLEAPVSTRVAVDRHFREPEDLVSELSNFDVVIATRMHMAILSMCAGVPAIGIAYEFKTTELYRRLGLPCMSLRMDTIDADAILSRAVRLLTDRAQVLCRFSDALDTVLRQLIVVEDELREQAGCSSLRQDT